MSLTHEEEQDLHKPISSLEAAFEELKEKIEKSGVLTPVDPGSRHA